MDSTIPAWNLLIKYTKYFLDYTPARRRLYDRTPVRRAFLKSTPKIFGVTYIEICTLATEQCFASTIYHFAYTTCNLHIKETEISQNRIKGIKNWKITYSVFYFGKIVTQSMWAFLKSTPKFFGATYIEICTLAIEQCFASTICNFPYTTCNLHIKETEISQKRSKGIKNWKTTYSVIILWQNNQTIYVGIFEVHAEVLRRNLHRNMHPGNRTMFCLNDM